MSIPKTPIKWNGLYSQVTIFEKDCRTLDFDDICRDLTEFYEMKRRQEECGKSADGHCEGYSDDCGNPIKPTYCCKCGAEL